MELVSVSKKKKEVLDEYNLEEGETADPLEIIDEGDVDIARVESGGSFGELALLDGKPRMATINCLTRCHMVVLSKVDYNKSLKSIDSKRLMSIVTFIRNIPIFQRLTRTFLTRFSYNV